MRNTTVTGSAEEGAWLPVRPFTQRLLDKLPGPARRWRRAWALVPGLQVAVMAVNLERTGGNEYGVLLYVAAAPNVAVFAYAILHAMWGSRRLTDEALALVQTISPAANAELELDARRQLASSWAPLVIATALAMTFGVDVWRRTGVSVALLNAPLDVLLYLPIATLLWTYFVVLALLGRAGRAMLAPGAYRGDRSLGLRPVGRLALRSFQVLLANLAPILLVTVGYGLGLVVGLAILIFATLYLFGALWGIHRAMRRAKEAQIARASAMYERAFEPLQASFDVDTLRQQSPLLGAAEALEKRAQSIQTWPFSDAIFARIVVIATGVVTSVVVKLVLSTLGM